jgi:integrase
MTLKWIYDGLRHTYGSMLYADTGDKSYVVDQMGHKGNTDIFDKHYKRLVRKDAAAEFWSLTPQKVSALVEHEESIGMGR